MTPSSFDGEVYPEVLYTHLGDEAAWRDTIRTTLVVSAQGGTSGIAGLPDPDVAAVSIEALVRHPLHDTGGVFVAARQFNHPLPGIR